MSSWRYVAVLLAVLGAFGLVQVRLVELSVRGWWLVAALAVLVCVGGIVVYVVGRRRVSLPATVRNLRRNRGRSDRSFEIVRKRCEARILDGESRRRDVAFRWTICVRNKKRARLGAADLVLLGEVPAFERDLEVYVQAGAGEEKFRVRVDRTDRLAPSLSIPLPAPGLARGEEAEFSFEYQWPVIAHLEDDTWVFDIGRLRPGATMEVELSYPRLTPQVAEARVVRRRFGLDRSRRLGRLASRSGEDGTRLILSLDYLRERHDDLLLIDTWASTKEAAG